VVRYLDKERLEAVASLVEGEAEEVVRTEVTWRPRHVGRVELTCKASNEATQRSGPLKSAIWLEVVAETKEAVNMTKTNELLPEVMREFDGVIKGVDRLKQATGNRPTPSSTTAISAKVSTSTTEPSLKAVGAAATSSNMMAKKFGNFGRQKSPWGDASEAGGRRKGRPITANSLAREEKRMMSLEEDEMYDDNDSYYDYSHFDYINERMNESFIETLLEGRGYEEEYNSYNYNSEVNSHVRGRMLVQHYCAHVCGHVGVHVSSYVGVHMCRVGLHVRVCVCVHVWRDVCVQLCRQ
jgi:hypothetical protein